MKKVLILTVFAIFMVSCKGSIVQLTAVPDFGDGENNQSDDDSPLTDHDSLIPDDDSLIPDDDSPFTDHDSPVTDDDSPFTDHDSPVTDDDVITCTEGELRCSSEDFDVEECDGGKWVTKEECGDGRICDDSVDPIVCADQICFPGAIYCKMGDVYSCASDGLSEEMTENCTDTQYCDEGDDPGECRDMVCVPNEVKCETNTLKKCNENGSEETTKECIDGSVCDVALKGCLMTDEIGKNNSSGIGTNRARGNYIECNKSVELIEFEMYLNFSSNTTITFLIYEDSNNNNVFDKIFSKDVNLSPNGERFYSSGNISVQIVSGRKYIFATSWEDSVRYYSATGVHPESFYFGSTIAGFVKDLPLSDQINYSSVTFSYLQRFKTLEK